jgi:hypothetical protein
MSSHACAANDLAGSGDNRAQAWGTLDDGCARRKLVHVGNEGHATRRSRAELRKLRDKVTSALLLAGFQFDPENAAYRDSGNASRYTIYRLPYTPLLTGEGALRPEIQKK